VGQRNSEVAGNEFLVSRLKNIVKPGSIVRATQDFPSLSITSHVAPSRRFFIILLQHPYRCSRVNFIKQRNDTAMTQPSHRTSLRAESPTYVGINEQMTMDELKSSCGNTGSANQDLRRFQLLSQTRFVTSYGRALVYAGLDDREQTALPTQCG